MCVQTRKQQLIEHLKDADDRVARRPQWQKALIQKKKDMLFKAQAQPA
ncbi:hypothetical protein [Pseudidiomarina homiensis]|nr:hypothetical protein [Pseudidiomarina homiensis]